MSAIDVIIAHGDALARAHLQSLAPDEAVVKQAGNFDDLLSAIRERPDVKSVIIDWSLPGLAGHIGVNYLAAHFPGVSITLLYSMATDVVDDHPGDLCYLAAYCRVELHLYNDHNFFLQYRELSNAQGTSGIHSR